HGRGLRGQQVLARRVGAVCVHDRRRPGRARVAAVGAVTHRMTVGNALRGVPQPRKHLGSSGNAEASGTLPRAFSTVPLPQLTEPEARIVMSRAYRIRVKESISQDLSASDEVCSDLEILEILPGDQMADLLEGELKGRGFEEEDGKLVRTKDGVTVTV